MNKEIDLKGLINDLVERSLIEISRANDEPYLFFNEKESEWQISFKYEDLKFSLKKAFTSELEELGFKHKE